MGDTEAWIRMYEEQVRHGRHHEALRSQSTNIIVAVSAALVAFLGSEAASELSPLAVGTFMAIINVYGFFLSIKHYERSRMHVTVAGEYRKVVSASSILNGTTIDEARERGRKKHQGRFKLSRWIRAYMLWSGLHVALALIGVLIAVQSYI